MADPFDKTTWTDKDRFYYEYIDAMLDDAVDARVSNVKPDHAAYLIRALLTHAKKHVRLFIGDLGAAERETIFESPAIAEAAKKLLSQEGSKLTIVVGEADDPAAGDEDQPLVRSILESQKEGKITGTMEIRRARQAAVDFLRSHHHYYPLMVMDESAYRVETGNTVTPAYANFGDRKAAREYALLFDDVLYSESEEVVAVAGGSADAAA